MIDYEESAEDLYENAPCGYLSMLRSGEIVRVNDTLCRWLGTPREALLGTGFQDLLPIGPKIFHDTHFAPLLRIQGFVNEVALEIRRADGHRLPVVVNATERELREGGPILRRLTIFDATDRRTFEGELLAAKTRANALAENRAQFLAMLSHDLRSPLQSIRLAAEILLRQPDRPPPPQITEVLTNAADQMLELVDSVLTLSRMEAGRDPVERQLFSIPRLVAELARVQQPRADQKGLVLTTDVHADVPTEVVGDAPKIKQVLGNLLSNALKFTDTGEVGFRVTLEEASEHTVRVRFLVEDTGPGIDPTQIAHIFDAYNQGGNPMARPLGGSGLGLSISRSIGDVLGGELGVSSTLGKGSAFWFIVPLQLKVS